jgi:hypothetical protein
VIEHIGTEGALEHLHLNKAHRLQLAVWQGFSDLIADLDVSVNAERDAII